MKINLLRIINSARASLRPPPKLTISQWADRYAYLSPESSAEPGKWKNIPYQIEIQDAICDPKIEKVTMKKSARVGYTKIIGNAICYYIENDPCPMMVVQPTEGDAEDYSKDEIAPLIRDTPVITNLVADAKVKDSGNTIMKKKFPGGTLSMVGANSPRGFRRVSRRIVFFDEVDGYPKSAGAEGDPIRLGIKRTEYYWNRKIVSGSTPTTARDSRIKKLFDESDQRYYHVPCPHCNELQVLKFGNLVWPKGKPELAQFQCIHCKAMIDHRHKRTMVEKGKWIPNKVSPGHAGFHIWAAYSYSPNATWGHIAAEFDTANKEGPEALKTFINTWLGEEWEDKGEVPDWEKLYLQREKYKECTVPPGVVFLTCGVDVQKNRIEYEVCGWGRDKQTWSIEYTQIIGDTSSSDSEVWQKLDEVVAKTYDAGSHQMPITKLAIDSGNNTQTVYNWARRHQMSKVMAIKGSDSSPTLINLPKAVDIKGKKRIKRGLMLWMVGVSIAKTELYSWLNLKKPTDEKAPYPAGYCHFPEYPEDYFKQLTAEQIKVKVERGFPKYQWEKVGERNEALDCRVYNRAAAAAVGIDRFKQKDWDALDHYNNSNSKAPEPAAPPPSSSPSKPKKQKREREKSGFWK